MTRPTVNLTDRNPWPAMVGGCVAFWLLIAGAAYWRLDGG